MSYHVSFVRSSSVRGSSVRGSSAAIAGVLAMLAGSGPGASQEKQAIEIGAAYQSLSRPINVSGQKGAQSAAPKFNFRLRETDAQDKNDKQLNDVQDLLAQGVKGLLVWPVDSGSATAFVGMAKRAGVPIIGVTTPFGRPDLAAPYKPYPGLAAFVTWDDIGAGRLIGGSIVDQFGKSGRKVKLAVLEGKSGFLSVDLRYGGFKEALKTANLDHVIVASQPGDWTQDRGEAVCQNVATANPDLDGIFSMSDEMSVGCARAIKASGRKIALYSIGGSAKGIDLIRKGELTSTVCFKPTDVAVLAVETMQKVLAGDESVIGKTAVAASPLISAANLGDCDPQW